MSWIGLVPAKAIDKFGHVTAVRSLAIQQQSELMTLRIDPMLPVDWPAVCEIYLEGIASRQATFETQAPSWEVWDASHSPFARLVAREAYAGVAEISVYVAQSKRGFGLGRHLLGALVAAAEENGIWSLQAVMFAENAASIALHRRSGFRDVGRRERIAKLDGAWRDTLLLERRSRKIGVD